MSRVPALLLVVLLASSACNGGKSAPGAGVAASNAPSPVSPPAGAASPQDSISAAADRGRVLGSESAGTWIVIVSDFQCPYCKTWHDETFPALRKEYVETGRVRMAYLNFPLNIHPNAPAAAMAAMCASSQGRFWEMADRIFGTQEKWAGLADPRAFFDSLATSSGVEQTRHRTCTQGEQLVALLSADMVRSQRSGAESTPTFFIGNHVVLGARPLQYFRAVIDSALAGK